VNEYRQMLDKRVVATCGSGGGIFGEGVVFAYAEKPTFIIRKADGSFFTWVCHLCAVVDDEYKEKNDNALKQSTE
jgi:hypothetical protein